MRLLLIEDDIYLGKAIHEGLREEYACDWFQNAEDGLSALEEVEYDVVILDINLPIMTGLELLSKLRKEGNLIPVLILTARDAVEQKVEGLDRGADDYLVKPFDFDELLARIRALLRRKGKYENHIIKYKNIELNTVSRIVTKRKSDNISHDNIHLSNKEFDILYLLMDNIGRCLSKEHIEQKIYDWNNEFESNTIEVYISSIRRKIGKDLIRTIRGVGYIMEPE